MKQVKRDMLFINVIIEAIPNLILNLCDKIKNVDVRILLTKMSKELQILLGTYLIFFILLEYLVCDIQAKE